MTVSVKVDVDVSSDGDDSRRRRDNVDERHWFTGSSEVAIRHNC